MHVWFGPAGNSESFSALGYKSCLQVPEYLGRFGLNAFEYQCGHGVQIGEETARAFGAAAAQADVRLSLHAPYFISPASADEAKRRKSVDYVLRSARAADWMGAGRIVVHPGGQGKFARDEAMDLAQETFQAMVRALDDAGLGHISICPETMGKRNLLGDVDEIIRLCRIDERMVPCIDFGHLNARTQGGLTARADFAAVLDALENGLGRERARSFHAHCSKIEYSAAGEVRHLTFADTAFGPDYAPLIDLIVQRDCTPVLICESAGTQAEDAQALMQMYLSRSEEQ